VEQHFYSVGDDDKRHALHQILRQRGLKQAFVFVNSKLGCARLARSLEHEGLKTTALHGDKSQDDRLKALESFKSGAVDLLVCTDVAARGLDIKDVPAVINFDIPYNAEDYVHRIGRTGRAGADGLAVNFVSSTDARLVSDIEQLIKTKIEIEAFEFEENLPDIRRQGHINDGRRMYREDAVRRGEVADKPSRMARSTARCNAPCDPFFDKPYEPATASDTPRPWEAAAVHSMVRRNIKSRRLVPALFKAG